MLTQFAASAWPAMPEASASVAYVQISDYLRLIFHQTNVEEATCPSCHTVNRGRVTRCRACGESMPSAVEQVETPQPYDAPGKIDFSDTRSLRNVLLLVLAPALLLSAAFLVWHALRAESKMRSEPAALVASRPIAPAVPLPALAPRKQFQEVSVIGPETRRDGTDTLPWIEEPAATQNADESVAEPSAPSTSSPRKASSHPRVGSWGSDPLATCRSRGWLARAICINTRCAQPVASRTGECRQALRQRRIDEARRNPTLMG